jgi:hypothetical protein
MLSRYFAFRISLVIGLGEEESRDHEWSTYRVGLYKDSAGEVPGDAELRRVNSLFSGHGWPYMKGHGEE